MDITPEQSVLIDELRTLTDATISEFREWETAAQAIASVLDDVSGAIDAEDFSGAVEDALSNVRTLDWSSPKRMSELTDVDLVRIENILDELHTEFESREEDEDDDEEDDGETDEEYLARVQPFSVGINGDPPVRLRRFATHGEASEFLEGLEGVQDGRYYLDGPERCECDDTATPGIAWPIASGGDDSFPFVESCDMCKRFADGDIGAAKALCEMLTDVGLDPALVNVFDSPTSEHYLVAVFPERDTVPPYRLAWATSVDEAIERLKASS